MEDFTEEDPGRGEPGAMDELTGQLRQDQYKLEYAHNAVRTSAGTVREHWHGKAGEAAAATHDALLTSIISKHQAIDRVIAACTTYRDTHEDVKDRARVWVIQLEQARQTVGSANAMVKGPKNAPGMADLIENATRSKTAALLEEHEALDRLATLYEERLEAGARFQSEITDITHETHGSGIAARAIDNPIPNGPPRQAQGPNDHDVQALRELVRRANDSVWEMAAAWVTGRGPRDFTWNESDPFTQVFRRSASAARVKSYIQEEILKGQNHGTWSYSAQGKDLPRDLVTILNGGGVGNLPEAFIGSFDYDYRVAKVNTDGTATVTIHAWNYTTVESATRIPGTGDKPLGPYYLGPYASMKFIQDVFGGYQPIRQDVTWTVNVRMP